MILWNACGTSHIPGLAGVPLPAELASLTRYSPVRDIVSSPVPIAVDLARA
jgi:hypothetical protein